MIEYDGQWVLKKMCTIDRYGGADDCIPCGGYEPSDHGCVGDCEKCPVQEVF